MWLDSDDIIVYINIFHIADLSMHVHQSKRSDILNSIYKNEMWDMILLYGGTVNEKKANMV